MGGRGGGGGGIGVSSRRKSDREKSKEVFPTYNHT